jgi:hypothetical protein
MSDAQAPKPEDKVTRRSLAGSWLWGTALIGAGAAAGYGVSRLRPSGPAQPGPGPDLGEAFTYDLSAYQKIDPALVQYREAGAFDTGFKRARGIAAAPDGRILVAGDEAVRIFGPDGARRGEFAAGDRPRCAAAAADGTLFAAMKDHVRVFDAEGKPKAAGERLGDRAVITSIAVADDAVYAADSGNREVVRLDRAGAVKARIGRKTPEKDVPGFVVPSPYFDLAIAADGQLRVVNPGRHRVETYTTYGDFVRAWGAASFQVEGFVGCCNPAHIALTPEGDFITSEKGIPRIKRYAPDGKLLAVVATPETLLAGRADAIDPESGGTGAAFGVAVDATGRVLALDPFTRKVRIFVKKN